MTLLINFLDLALFDGEDDDKDENVEKVGIQVKTMKSRVKE